MHIVFLTTEYPGITNQNGGIAEYVRKISQKLVNSGHKVSVIISGETNLSKKNENVNLISFKSLNYWEGMDENFVSQSFRIIRILVNASKFSREVNKLNQSEKINLLQAPNYLFPGLFLSSNKYPVVCRLSSYAPLLRKAYGKKNNFINDLEDFLEILSVKGSFAVFAPSKLMGRIYSHKLNKEISVIKTPVDEKLLSPQKISDKSINKKLRNLRVITYFGSFSRLKGLDLIADIIPDLISKYKDILFLFIGKDYGIPGYGPVVTYIHEKAGESSNRIIIKDQLGKEELFSLIRDSYCCLFPSRIDNSPNTCIEAISLGIPVIGSDGSSLEEMIIDSKTGFIFKNSDSNDLKNKIEKMLNLSDKEYKGMKKNVNMLYKKIQNEKRTQELINFYKRTLDGFKNKK